MGSGPWFFFGLGGEELDHYMLIYLGAALIFTGIFVGVSHTTDIRWCQTLET